MPGPNELPRGIHRNSRLFATKFHNNSSVVKADSNTLLALLVCNAPSAFKAVVERLLEAVSVGMPDAECTVLGPGNDDWKLRVVAGKGHIVGVALERGDERLGCIIPNFDGSVVRGGEDVRLVGMRIVIDVVNAFRIVGLESEVGSGRSKTPNFDSTVKASRSKGVGILGINSKTHDIMAVSLENLYALPPLFPIPELDGHVIGRGKDEWLRRVNSNGSDVVRVGFEGGDFLRSVVIVDSHLEVIGTADNPVLASNKATGTNGDIGELEGLYDLLRLVRPNVDVA